MVLTSIRGREQVEPACHPRTVSSRLPRNRAELTRKRAVTDGHNRKGQASPAAATRSFPIDNLPSGIDGFGKHILPVAKEVASVLVAVVRFTFRPLNVCHSCKSHPSLLSLCIRCSMVYVHDPLETS